MGLPVNSDWVPEGHGGRNRPLRVLRGGSWNNNNRDNVLSSNRNNNDPDNRNENIGFRAVVEAGSGRKVVNAPKHRRDLAWLDRLRQRSQETPNPPSPALEKILRERDQGKDAAGGMAGRGPAVPPISFRRS